MFKLNDLVEMHFPEGDEEEWEGKVGKIVGVYPLSKPPTVRVELPTGEQGFVNESDCVPVSQSAQ